METYTLQGFALTHQGNVRGNNEDNYYLFGAYKTDTSENQREEPGSVTDGIALAAVFDGMGGEAAGEVASLIAAKSVQACELSQINEQAEAQLRGANDLVCEEIRARGSRMGSTAVQLYFDRDSVVCVNLGDSRAYMYRGGTLMQLSKDHSEGQRLVDMGMATEEEAKKSNNWHKLTQHLGIFPEEFIIEPFIGEKIALKAGDIYLLCSDGLTDMLSNEQIGILLSQSGGKGLNEVAEQLRDAALAAGGKDNVTVVLVRVIKDTVNVEEARETAGTGTANDVKPLQANTVWQNGTQPGMPPQKNAPSGKRPPRGLFALMGLIIFCLVICVLGLSLKLKQVENERNADERQETNQNGEDVRTMGDDEEEFPESDDSETEIEETDKEGSEEDSSIVEGSVSDDSISGNSISGNAVSGNSPSDDAESDNSVPDNSAPENTVPEETGEDNAVNEGTSGEDATEHNAPNGPLLDDMILQNVEKEQSDDGSTMPTSGDGKTGSFLTR